MEQNRNGVPAKTEYAAYAALGSGALDALMSMSGVGMWSRRLPEGAVKFNWPLEDMAGYGPGELPQDADTLVSIIHPDDRQRAVEHFIVCEQGVSDGHVTEYRLQRKDGSTLWVRDHGAVTERDSGGRPRCVSGIVQAMGEGERRQMEKQQQAQDELVRQGRLLRAVNEAAQIIIGNRYLNFDEVIINVLRLLGQCVDADRAYLWNNTTVDGKLCCSQRGEWARHKASMHGEAPPVCLPYDDLVPEWRELTESHTHICAPVSELGEHFKAFPGMQDVQSILLLPIFFHGEFWGFIGFDHCKGCHEYTGSEIDILKSGGMLLASAVQRNLALQEITGAKEAAQASTRAKTEFLSRMSHEIRTPMNAIIGMTAIGRKAEDMQRVQYCLGKIDASSRQLLSIINDVLDMSKIDSGKFEITQAPFNFEKMMGDVLNVIGVKVDEKHQNFKFDFDSVFTRKVVSDELRLSQVLINLLTNAVKFTPECGNIILRVREAPEDEGHSRLRIEVEDNGIGITPEQQARLFTSFEQADGSITRRFGGTGLGLAICKKIVTLMGGDNWVESEVGQGSRFIFEIQVGWGDPLTATAPAGLQKGIQVLVVDDAPDVLEYFRNILTGFQLSCDTASNGAEALALVKKAVTANHPYDMVFIDWNMPGLGGGDTAREIKRLMRDNVIVVMISVADWSDIEPQAKAYGIRNFLSKPVLPSVMYNTIVELSQQTLVTGHAGEKSPAHHWRERTILLVEDIEINREIVASVLEETGVSIEYAFDGAQAVERFRTDGGRYDLILMDVQMPVLDGLGATRQIRAMGGAHAADVPIIAMTANAFKEDEQLCLDAGMNGHVAKPLDVDELMQILGTYLD